MARWNDFTKIAQVWGNFLPAHDAEAAKEWHKATVPVAKKIVGTPIRAVSALGGAAIGAIKQYSDAVGAGALPAPDVNRSWIDYAANPSDSVRDTSLAAEHAKQIALGAREGAKVGWRDAGRVADEAAVAAARTANNFWLYPDYNLIMLRRNNDKNLLEQIKRYDPNIIPENPPKDRDGLLVPMIDEKGDDIPGYEKYNEYIKWNRGGGDLASGALSWATPGLAGKGAKAVAGKLVKTMTRPVVSSRQVSPAVQKARQLMNLRTELPAPATTAEKVVPSVAGAAGAAVDIGVGGSKDASRRNDEAIRDAYAAQVARLAESGLEPGTREYKDAYDELSRGRGLDSVAFDSLPKPTYVPSATESQGATPPEGGSGWVMPASAQNMLGYGIGGAGLGAILGSLFGGRGGWWKLGLLGLLLGSLGGAGGIGGLKNAWGDLQKSWGGNPS